MLKIEKPKKAYKLFRKRKKDGAITSLFINKNRALPNGQWLKAEDHKTKGFSHRPGWHCSVKPKAPHLGEEGREWWEVEICNWKKLVRPQIQGGAWVLSEWVKLVKPCPKTKKTSK